MTELATDAEVEEWPELQAWDFPTYQHRVQALAARCKAEIARAERAETRVRLLESKEKREVVKRWWER